jgi:hypothetical protein
VAGVVGVRQRLRPFGGAGRTRPSSARQIARSSLIVTPVLLSISPVDSTGAPTARAHARRVHRTLPQCTEIAVDEFAYGRASPFAIVPAQLRVFVRVKKGHDRLHTLLHRPRTTRRAQHVLQRSLPARAGHLERRCGIAVTRTLDDCFRRTASTAASHRQRPPGSAAIHDLDRAPGSTSSEPYVRCVRGSSRLFKIDVVRA